MSRRLALILFLLAGAAGCESGGSSEDRPYYGPGWGDPWYYGDRVYYDEVPVTPPPRLDRPPYPGRPPHPSHLPAYSPGRPSQLPAATAAPRPMPSIPSRPRMGGGRGGRR